MTTDDIDTPMHELKLTDSMTTAVVPSRQKQVIFYESEITAVFVDGDVYASIRHMCQALGLDVQAQIRRMGRNDVLADGLRVATVATHRRGSQTTYVLRADLVPMWLVGVDTRHMEDDKKQRLNENYEL